MLQTSSDEGQHARNVEEETRSRVKLSRAAARVDQIEMVPQDSTPIIPGGVGETPFSAAGQPILLLLRRCERARREQGAYGGRMRAKA